MGLLGKLLLGIALALIAQHAVRVLYLMRFHRTVYNHAPGKCHLVPGVEEGSEDIHTLSDGIALITSGLKWRPHLHKPYYMKRKGRILMFDFNNVDAGVSEIRVEGIKLNNPHGIGVWEDGKQVVVFVVNHFLEKEGVVQLEFDRERKVLQHMKTIYDSSFVYLNDVVPTGPNSFYVTNFCGSPHLFQFWEMILFLKWSSVFHYDGSKIMVAADGINGANGVNLSPDGRFAYVASSLTGIVHVYKRLFDHRLEHFNDIPVYSIPDNIDVEKNTGDLWIGLQPITFDCMQHLEDHTHKCASQVLRLKMKDGKMEHMEEVYSEDNLRIHCSTVANYYKGAMLVGTIIDKLLYCQVSHLN